MPAKPHLLPRAARRSPLACLRPRCLRLSAQVPRSFASLFTDDEEEVAAIVDPSLLIANCGLSDSTVSTASV